MSFDTLAVKGYLLSEMSFGFAGPLLAAPGREDAKKITGLELRDHGLAGGEIQLFLSPANRGPSDPGYWYAAKCDHDPQSSKRVVGTIWLRRMGPDDVMVDDMSCPLEELDRGHLLDRLQGEVLRWHAKNCGPGPFATPVKPRRKRP